MDRNPLYWKAHDRLEEANYQRQKAQLDRMEASSHMLNARISHELGIGLIVRFWRSSWTLLFAYVLPFWIFLFGMVMVMAGNYYSKQGVVQPSPAAITFYVLAAISLMLFVGSILFGISKARGSFLKAVSRFHGVVATAFVLTTVYQQRLPEPPPNAKSGASSYVLLVLFLLILLCFFVTIFATFVPPMIQKVTGAIREHPEMQN